MAQTPPEHSESIIGAKHASTRIYLERGKTWVFAAAIDWPGWCRRGKGDEAAIEALVTYAPRYARIVGEGFDAVTASAGIEVVGTEMGTATTDFGAPDARGAWDHEPLPPDEAARQVDLLRSAWQGMDDAVAHSPAELRKGPRGGGRDRDAMADHVREAERAYARTIGVRMPPRTPWPEQREAIAAALLAGPVAPAWQPRYWQRRAAWHILDHVWEMEDRRLG